MAFITHSVDQVFFFPSGGKNTGITAANINEGKHAKQLHKVGKLQAVHRGAG